MGLGGYLAAKGDATHYESERQREEREIVERVQDEEREIYEIFSTYGVSQEESTPVLNALKRKPQAWVDFMMRFELGLEEPDPRRARRSALTIALSYIAGGLVPLAPYFFLGSVQLISVGILGEYIGSIHTYVQKRPLVVERERVNFEYEPGMTQRRRSR